MKVKQIFTSVMIIVVLATMLTGCGKANKEFTTDSEIVVISREDGSGTRSAFVELTGVLEKTETTVTDNTVPSAIIQNNTQAVLTGVAGDNTAVGYISLGSLNDTVTAMKIEGVAPSAESIKDGSYKISRPFNIATKATVSEPAENFINYVLSTEGQKTIAQLGYVGAVENSSPFTGVRGKGTVKIAGSSSVSPVIERLAEEYEKINPDVNIEVNTNDSSTGMTSTAEGVVDIGMASRELKESEIKKGLTGIAIAKDGIAVVINKENTVTDITLEQLKSIYTGEVTTWEF